MESNITGFNLSLDDALDEEASHGICTKWKKTIYENGKKGYLWIKAGSKLWGGYMHDSLGEIIASQVAVDLGIDGVVRYRPCVLSFKDEVGTNVKTIGCYSYDFTGKNEEVVTIDELSRESIAHLDYFELINYVNEMTGISKDEFREYLDRALLLDSIILNVDRRLGNLAVLKNTITGKYRICPIFDNGQSFGLQNNSWEYDGKYEDICITNFVAKPFKCMHDEQLIYTHYYLHDEGQAELARMFKRSLRNSIELVKMLYEYFGYGVDETWNKADLNRVMMRRTYVKDPMVLPERDYIISQLKRRFEIAIGRQESTYVPKY